MQYYVDKVEEVKHDYFGNHASDVEEPACLMAALTTLSSERGAYVEMKTCMWKAPLLTVIGFSVSGNGFLGDGCDLLPDNASIRNQW